MARHVLTAALVLVTVGLWALYKVAPDYHLFGTRTSNAVLWAAWALTTIVLVALLGRLLLVLGFALLDLEATGIHRGIVYSVLTFVIVSAALASLGLNISAILTTSAVATAIVGLAMQPTIGSLIAGSTLHLDRVLRVGDRIVMAGERIEVLSLNWRSVVGRKQGGTIVVIPNSRVSEAALDILPQDKPMRVEVSVPGPITVPPHRMSAILSETAYNLPYVDPSRPVRVAPLAYEANEGCVKYRVRFWIRRPYQATDSQTMLLSRIWYAFQRADIPWPISSYFVEAIDRVALAGHDHFKGRRLNEIVSMPDSISSLVLGAPEFTPATGGRVITDVGPVLCYADRELVWLPERVADFSFFLLVEGELRETAQRFTQGDSAPTDEPQGAQNIHVNRRMALDNIAARLARHIGPYADYAVQEAAQTHGSLASIGEIVAMEIDDPAEREAFLLDLGLEHVPTHKPGYLFGSQRNATEDLVASPVLCAVRGAVIVPLTLAPAAAGNPRLPV